MNQIQIVGTHNSYHAGLAPGEMALWRKLLPPQYAHALDYSHAPLAKQLDLGMRQLEIDIYPDSAGGLYAHPKGIKMVSDNGFQASPPFDTEGLMDKPGMKVFHILDLDFRSTCQPLVACLTIVRDWSNAHPGHMPISLLIEPKKYEPMLPAWLTIPEPWTAKQFNDFEAEVHSVFPENKLITPDMVRGNHATLEEAVLHNGWPSLNESKGKILLIMDPRMQRSVYLEGHPSLKGRVMFTNALPGEDDAAFVEVNDPEADPAMIPSLVKRGYVVRTRADADVAEALTGKTSRREAAFASGAQFVSTDFPAFEPAPETKYSVVLLGKGAARCNPVNATKMCKIASTSENK